MKNKIAAPRVPPPEALYDDFPLFNREDPPRCFNFFLNHSTHCQGHVKRIQRMVAKPLLVRSLALGPFCVTYRPRIKLY